MKKLFAFLTMMVLATSAFAQTYDFSAVCETGQTLYYQISNPISFEVILTAPGYPIWNGYEKPSGDLIIPEHVEHEGNTYTVVSVLGSTFYQCTELTSVEIPNSVIFMGSHVFFEDSALESVVLPNRINTINEASFLNCLSLTSVTLPDSLTSIGRLAFFNCESLDSFFLPNTLESIGEAAFNGCSSLSGELVIPSSLQNLGDGCFSGCSSLSSVVLPENMSSIPSYTFSGCTSLSGDLVIPNQCTSIGWGAFFNCSSLHSLTIGSSVSSISHEAFMNCTGLEAIHCNTPTLPYSAPIQNDPYYEDHGVFENVPSDIPVYVNCLAIDQFQTSPHWNQFTNMQGVFFGAPSLTVEVNNPDFGLAEIVSIPDDCDHLTATVRAIPNLGHIFGYWKRNGAVVSYSPEYTFTLNHDCVMTACFDCSATVYDSIGYPDHVVARKYNNTGQVTNEYVSDFSYDQNGVLNRYYFPGYRNCYFSFFEYPSKPSSITIYFVGSHPETTETLNFTYEDDHQIRHCDHYRGNVYYDELNNHDDYYYNNHKLFLKESSWTDEDGVTHISSRIKYSYENGNRTRIDSTYTGTTKLSSVTTNHYNERQQILTSQTDTYDNTGTVITSRSSKTYTYTDSNKTDNIITQMLNEGEWVNSSITHYIYDFKNRVIEYQTGSWLAETSEWDIAKKTLYDFDDDAQKVTISFRKKNNDEWEWDVFSGQSLFNDPQLYEWQRQLTDSYPSYYYPVNQFEISMHYNTIEQDFPILSEWYYEIEWENGNITYQHLEYAADTTIGTQRPKIIVRSNTHYDRDSETEVTHEYIYEQNNKVYWWNKDLQEFTVLYDYAAEAGDEWEIKVGTESILVHVDSVGVFEYDGDTRKMLHISDAGNIFNGDIVVGYGHMTSFFPEKLMRHNADFTVNGLRCYWVDDALLYHNGEEDCDAIYSEIHGVEEDGPSTGSEAFTVYPNPANGVLFVQTLRATSLPAQYRITNLIGQNMLTGNISDEIQKIDIESLPSGMYFISVGEQTAKFVKQ